MKIDVGSRTTTVFWGEATAEVAEVEKNKARLNVFLSEINIDLENAIRDAVKAAGMMPRNDTWSYSGSYPDLGEGYVAKMTVEAE